MEDGLGGIVGSSLNTIIEQSFNEGTVTSKYTAGGNRNIGGIVGFSLGSTVKNCYNIGDVKGNSYVGGIIGRITSAEYFQITESNSIYNSYNATTEIDGDSYAGSLGGWLDNVNTYYCFGVTDQLAVAGGENINHNNSGKYTIDEMKTSALLNNLKNGEGTEDGNSLWAQDSNINGGLPYLVNNH